MNKLLRAGFSLIEMIVVMMVTSVIVAIVVVFIRWPTQSYFDSVARADLADTADTALRRMARDMRLALPNSIRVQGNYVEFLLTSAGGRYLSDDDDPVNPNKLTFGGATSADCASTSCKFAVLGWNLMSAPIVPGNFIVVNNLGAGQDPADAYTGGNLAKVANFDASTGVVTLASNPFAIQTALPMPSPASRFHVVTTPVTYGCANNVLTRYWGYPITSSQNAPPTGGGLQTAILAKGVTNCNFAYALDKNISRALVGITLSLQNTDQQSVTLVHQVYINNTP